MNDDFIALFNKVREDRKQGNSQCISADDKYSITKLLNEIVEKQIYKTDYENITEHVLYEYMPYEKVVLGLKQLINSRLFG